jgi:tetratricopeptide (TPR) repeat protein
MVGFLLLVLTAAGAVFSFRSPSEKEMLDRFAEAQRFYAEGAYRQAIDTYDRVAGVQSRVLESKLIIVEVGEASYPVQEAAIYQVGNANGKLFSESAALAAGSDDEERRHEFEVQADSALARSSVAFRRVIEEASNATLRGQAYGRLIELYYEAERFPRVIEVSRELIATYGDDPLAKVGYYNTGWSHFRMEQYAEALTAFQALVERFPTGFEADRSLFQIGECYLEMERYDEAVEAYRELVARQRLDDMSDEERRRMEQEKLAGLVDETALELAAKSQIRIGTALARAGRQEEGIAAFRLVIEQFSTERSLVEEAYLQMASLYEEQGDIESATQTYREAIREARDRTLRARIQYALAERLFIRGAHDAAIREYRIYLQGYGDVAGQAGFPVERVRYRLGSAHQQWAQSGDDGDPAATARLHEAVAQYDTLLAAGGSTYDTEARFNRAVARQSLESDADLAAALEEYEALLVTADDDMTLRVLLQVAQLHMTRQDYGAAQQAATAALQGGAEDGQAMRAHLFLALARQAQGDLAGAAEAFGEIDAESDLYVRAALGRGHALVSLGRHAEAETVLEAAAPDAGDNEPSFRYLIGQARQARDDAAGAIEAFTQGLAAAPQGDLAVGLHLARGNVALVSGNTSQAVADFRWVAEQAPDEAQRRQAQDALAIAYLRQDRGGEALELLDEMTARAATPEEEAELLSRILDLYYEQDDFVRTQEVAQRLLVLSFDDAPTGERDFGLKEKAWLLLGDAQIRSGRESDAIDSYRQALEAYPGGRFAGDMALSVATLQFASGDLEEAAERFEVLRAGTLGPEQRFTVDYYLANARYSLRQFDEARGLFEELLRDNPEAPERADLLFGLGETHYQLGDFENAATRYRQVLAEFPTDSAADDAQYNLAWCLIEMDRQDDAMEQFRRLLEAYPESEYAPSAQFTFGDYHYNRQDYLRALEAYRAVQNRYPAAEVTAKVPRLIDELNESIAYDEYARGLALMDSAEAADDGEEYYRQAIEVFQIVREQYPGTESEIGAISNMAVCLEALDRWREAVELYDEVISKYENQQATREAFQFAKAHRDWIMSARL